MTAPKKEQLQPCPELLYPQSQYTMTRRRTIRSPLLDRLRKTKGQAFADAVVVRIIAKARARRAENP